jgi:hypothetical protein
VQSTFREFHDYVSDEFVMRIGRDGKDAPASNAAADLAALAAGDDGWVIEPHSLERGRLLEVEVALDADDSFRASTIFTTLYGFLKDMPQLPPTINREELMHAVTGMRLLDGLLAGLVPVRGRALYYSHVTEGGRDYLVHRAVLERLGADSDRVVQPLFVVGVTEDDLFWRDLRRVLFSSSRYRMLCRLDRSGVQTTWTPVKLTDVLGGVVPALEGLVDQIPAMLTQVGSAADDDGPAERMCAALTDFAVAVSGHYGESITPEELAARGLPTREQTLAHGTADERRDAFNQLARDLGVTADRADLTRFRTQALLDAKVIDLDGDDVQLPSGAPRATAERLLDCEIIAIYW